MEILYTQQPDLSISFAIKYLSLALIGDIVRSMLTYVRSDVRHYVREPLAPVGAYFLPPSFWRSAWEFQACVEGGMAAWLPDPDNDEIMRERTLWVFPSRHKHSWLSDAPCERVVLHFETVPHELERLLPPRGYYRVPLSKGDCTRLRVITEEAAAALRRPTGLQDLYETMWKTELSLIALRESRPQPLTADNMAEQRARTALHWYAVHMVEQPSFEQIAHAVHISPAHLRREFIKARGERPRDAFTRLRMQRAEELLHDPRYTLDAIAEQVGFANAANLSRAMKAHFGLTPRELRKRKPSA
jgi:AraC family transcriptional regulator